MLYITLVGVGLVSVILLYSLLRKSKPAPLPPGPRGLPLLGNFADLPKIQPWAAFSKLGEKYGGIVYLSVAGKPIIVLNDARYALDMFDKKSRIYSDRPQLVMAGQLIGWDRAPPLAPWGRAFTEFRRLFSQVMGTRAKVHLFKEILDEETHRFLKNILANPKSWVEHTRKFSGAIVLKITYGYKVENENDPMVKLADDAMNQWSEMSSGNVPMVDLIPILRFVPEWFPGAAWKKKVSLYKQTLETMVDSPYNWTKRQIAAGTARPSFLYNILDSIQMTSEEEFITRWGVAGIYAGGTDTTVSGMESFFLAMTLHTTVQLKAQAELDTVLGIGVLPTLADRARLPYVEALVLEVLRLYPFVPTGLPHVPVEDDIQDGYFIPKGSIIFPNIWQFLRDPGTYKDPERFYPERFMASEGHSEKDPRDYAFGFGRRRCPGIHLADASMWLVCASVLAAFDIRPPLKDGHLVLPSGRFTEGSISHPEPFECTINPRAGAVEAITRSSSGD